MDETEAQPHMPSGTVTFLFTDVEGSTKLLERIREDFRAVIAEHNALFRAAFAKWNGREIQFLGDGFHAAFRRATDAVNCVAELQRELAQHTWPAGATVRVRMGLNTGEAEIEADHYVGIGVHRAARVAAAGHGGQVLLSQTTRDLVYMDLPPGVALRDLGAHLLKDIRYPQPIYQLDIEGLPTEFPALRTLGTEEPPAPGEPPYKGLQYFGEADAEWFFGRDETTARLVEDVREQRFLTVVGASGSGKSSIIRAGLLPALRRATDAHWEIAVITPTVHPLEALAMGLTRNSESVTAAATLMDDLGRDSRSLHLHILRSLPPSLASVSGRGVTAEVPVRFLLVVDQFEELFALCHHEPERRAFVDNLLYAVEAEGGATTVVIALRADFYDHLSPYVALREAVARQQEYIGPMNVDELRLAIEEPARRGGWEFVPGLVDLMLHDVGASRGQQPEPGALPLLSHALLETWRRRRGNTMTLRGYNEAGGVRGAIAQTAENVFRHVLTPQQQPIARSIFLRLTELGEEGTQDTRRRAAPSELVRRVEDAPAVETVLETLADARLITMGEDTVEVAHEALIREWPTLREWLEEDREGLRTHRRLTKAAQEWERLNREPDELYRGARLATASEWAETHVEALNLLEREFLTASRELAEQEEAEREARRRRTIMALTGALAIAIVLTIFAFNARATARREAAVNHSLVLAANAQQAQDEGDVDLALALALEAVDLDQPPSEAARALSALALGPGTRAVLSGHNNAVRAVAFHPDGKTALSGSCSKLDSSGGCVQGELTLWDLSAAVGRAADAGTKLHQFQGHTGWVNSIAFSPDGETAISGSSDGSLILWDVSAALHTGSETGQMVRRFEGHTGAVNSVALSPEGQTALSGSDDATLILWDVTTGEPIRRFEGHIGGVNSVAFSPDGQTALSASADTTLILWDVTSGEEVRRFEGHIGNVSGVAFNHDGRTMLSTGDNTLRLWDLETGEQINQVSFPSGPEFVKVSPDGQTAMFALAGLRLWDIARWREIHNMGRLSIDVWAMSAAYSADGRLVLSGFSDGGLRLWNLGSQGELRRFATDGAPLAALAVSPDGRHLLTGDMAGVAVLWDVESGEVIRRLEGDAGAINPNCIAFSPDGRTALVGSGDAFGGSGAKSLVLWDTQIGEEIRRFEGHIEYPRSVAISPDGRTALSGSQGMDADVGDLILWDLGTGELIRRFDTSEDITDIAFAADGNRALTTSAYFDNTTLWDVATGQEILRFEGHTSAVFDVALGPGETTALSASADGSAMRWDLESGGVIRRYLGHDDMVWSLDVSPDGRYLISGSLDGTVILWDLESGEELRRFDGHSEIVTGMAFHPDGQTAYTVSADGSLIEWQISDLPLDELIDWTYANRYVRGLSCEERETYRITPLCGQ